MQDKARTALVTGASSGIGRETALRLASKGFHVIAAARRMDQLEEMAQNAPSITPRKVDMSEPSQVEEFCGYISGLEEPVTALVNNAGYSIRGALEDLRIEDIRRLFEVNFFSLVRITQACLPGMRRMRRGRIVNLSSIVGRFSFPMTGGMYSATKHAVEAVSEALRMEVRPFGIEVAVIRPGPIATEFNEAATAMSGDPVSRTSDDYRSVYDAAGAGMGRMFSSVSIPGPEIIADLIMDAVLSDKPRVSYCAGPFSDEILVRKTGLDDDAFDNYLTQLTGLAGLKV
jgi:short-subunit dehydrogenase